MIDIDENIKGNYCAQILVYKMRNPDDDTPIWNCAKQHNNEKHYLVYRELASRMANPKAPGYQKLCEAFIMGEDDEGYLTENDIRTIKKEYVEQSNDCSYGLNVLYNTKRLKMIFNDYKKFIVKRYKGKCLTQEDIDNIIGGLEYKIKNDVQIIETK